MIYYNVNSTIEYTKEMEITINSNISSNKCMLTPTTGMFNNNQCTKTTTVVVEEVVVVVVDEATKAMNGGINKSYTKITSRVIDDCFFCYVCNLINISVSVDELRKVKIPCCLCL